VASVKASLGDNLVLFSRVSSSPAFLALDFAAGAFAAFDLAVAVAAFLDVGFSF
jgi:hypothetical protein